MMNEYNHILIEELDLKDHVSITLTFEIDIDHKISNSNLRNRVSQKNIGERRDPSGE